jgi:hypothetical protein
MTSMELMSALMACRRRCASSFFLFSRRSPRNKFQSNTDQKSESESFPSESESESGEQKIESNPILGGLGGIPNVLGAVLTSIASNVVANTHTGTEIHNSARLWRKIIHERGNANDGLHVASGKRRSTLAHE